MFKCKVCLEKDNRIKDLYSQIEFLKRMVSPSDYALPTINTEMNYTLDGAGREEIIMPEKEYTEDELKQYAADRAEEQAILSGTY